MVPDSPITMDARYGFANEVKVKYEEKLMELFSETFRNSNLHLLEGSARDENEDFHHCSICSA